MPRVQSLTPEKRIEDKIYGAIYAAMGLHGLKKKDIADALGLHKSTVSEHFANRSFSFMQLLSIFEFLELEISICGKSL